MKSLDFSCSSFSVTTYGKTEHPRTDGFSSEAMIPGGHVCLSSRDQLPCFYGKKGSFLSAELFNRESALDGSSIAKVETRLRAHSISPADLEVYLAPCLTFSHTIVNEETIQAVIGRGYREACKRTDGIDFLDVPLIVLIQFRHIGVKMENIHIASFDTSENPSLLYSASNGDDKDNLSVATLQ